jgi:hypothetical protein
MNGSNILSTKFRHENVKYYGLKNVKTQNDLHFINILNRFQIASQINKDINFINDNGQHNTHLFHTNLKAIFHNKIVY